MGVAIFFGLVFIMLGLLALTVYGVCLGCVRLAQALGGWGRRGRPAGHAEPRVAAEAEPRLPRLVGTGPARCWEYKRCPVATREACPAFGRPEAPCWLACMQATQTLKPECLTCRRFNLTQLFQTAGR